MPTRKPNLADLEAATGDTPPMSIPAGAQITAKFNTPVDPASLGGASRYSDELHELADEEFPDAPADPLSEFLTEWRSYVGYPLKIVRLPDPADRRMPGQTYNRTRFGEIEQLGDTTFDPVNFVSTLQILNGNSGGVFRVWLTDEVGAPIPGARLDRIAIGDPPKQYNAAGAVERERYQPQPPPAPVKPEPSELELQLQELQRQMLQRAMAKVLDPPMPPPAPLSAPIMSDEDRLTLLLVNQGGLLPTVVQRLATLAGAPESATAKQTWSDWAKDIGGELVRTNPEIAERITNTAANVIGIVLDKIPVLGKLSQSPQQQRQQQQYTEMHQLTPSAAPGYVTAAHPTGLPEAPEPEDEDDDQDVMDILDEFFTLLTDTKPLTANDPVFLQLAQDYPLKFKGAVMLIASQPLPDIIAWIENKSPLYSAMLNSPITGTHYRQRLAELQTLCRTPANDNEKTQAAAPVQSGSENESVEVR